MVRKRKDGRWEGRIVIEHKENGDSIFHYFSAPTQRKLMETLAQANAEYAGVNLCGDCQMPLGDWLDQYVKPALGEKPVCKVTRADIQKLYQELLEHGRVHEDADGSRALSPSTVCSLHSVVLHQSMDAAVRQHLTAHNPTEGVTQPKQETVAKTILNDEQLERFMEAIRQDELWYDFFYTEITTMGISLLYACCQ